MDDHKKPTKKRTMKELFHIKDDADRQKVIDIIPKIPTGHFVKIIPNEGIRRLRAVRYYFGAIITPFAEFNGDLIADLHDTMKRKHLHAILQRTDDSYAEMMMALRDLYSNGKRAQALYIQEYNFKRLTTTQLSSADFNAFSNQVKRQAQGLGVRIMSKKEWEESRIKLGRPLI